MKSFSSLSGEGGLPAHWRRGRTLAALSIFFLCLALSLATRTANRVEQSDLWWLCTRFALRETLRPNSTPDADIVLVEIDDRSVNKWKEPLIAWGPHFAAALDKFSGGGARVIALDWIQPISTAKWFPGNDEKLKYALHRASNVVLVKEFRTDQNGKPHWILPTDELLYALPDSAFNPDAHLGYAEWSGKESIIASTTVALSEETSQKTPTLSLAARTVERYFGVPSRRHNGSWEVGEKTSVPLRGDESLVVNYRNFTGTPRAFRRYSFADIAAMSRAEAATAFKNKIVVVGATYKGSNDSHYVPIREGAWTSAGTRLISGVEVQANVMRTLLDSRPIQEPSANLAVLFSLVLGTIGLLAFSILRWGGAAFVCAITALAWLALSLVLFVRADYALPAALPLLNLLLAGGAMGAYRALGEERERAQVMKVWGRYQDPRVVEYALQNPEIRGGEGREVVATVLFADLKNFTKTVESLAPEEALHQLNRYLALISDTVLQHGGLVDKYLGDGLMAQWGVPQPQADHAAAAVRACLELERKAHELSAATERTGEVSFGLRLTLHSGPVVAGNVGAESRLEFTIIGDTVNVTSRLQETAKQLDCEFLISESTYNAVKEWAVVGQQSEVEIRGRQQPLQVYEILGENRATLESDQYRLERNETK
ncbi:MAG TPA: adenylate/guanylate cyclase domain-containing protein [Abditibacteriaceae bacterium]